MEEERRDSGAKGREGGGREGEGDGEDLSYGFWVTMRVELCLRR